MLESENQQIRLLCVERYVVVRGQMLRLTPIECTLLLTLMREGGKVLTHQSLLHAVWGAGYHEEVDYIRVSLHTLRLKLEDDPRHPIYLETEPLFSPRVPCSACRWSPSSVQEVCMVA
ncbi:hypothetical protein KSD_72170 [Ktedonobacter sp. SOSP1-85]|uniref:winged helix-turn-helix domain-containing protein n=1 Tax=Ktedonobacter sp. SOSP1-85 TaxID=2778367 RepID=UPI001A2CB271|nr:winged helix-turn-helix domain-containing protein [Ktedonobacter sp. SOSP1-85]GHO79446.1 hypothetical protein KSD_72170 [Ktedonobacter sp. SOSP1-85]